MTDPVIKTSDDKTSDNKMMIVSDSSKEGLITATGVILAFVLGFFVNFSSSDHPWQAADFIPLGLLVMAILTLALTLYRVFIPHHQTVKQFEGRVRLLMVGILLSLLGAIAGVFV